MKFSTILFSAGLIAAVAAVPQATTSVAPVPTTPTTSYDDKTTTCLGECKEEDVGCRASCFGNPNPTEEQVNETTKCSAACKQGDGSAEETEAYGKCQRACAEKYFLPQTSAVDNGGSSTSTSTGSGPRVTDENGNVVNNTNGNNNTTNPTSGNNGGSGASSFFISGSLVGAVAGMVAFFAL